MLNPFANRKLLRRGEPARARIVEMSTPEHGAEPSNVTMTLLVDFRGAGPYEVRDRWMVSGTEPISSGSDIWVVVDPENRHRVVIDWDRTRADYRERTDARRRVLSTGIPIPVTKVREALEQAGELRSTAVADAPVGDQAAEAEVEPAAEPELIAVAAAAPPSPPVPSPVERIGVSAPVTISPSEPCASVPVAIVGGASDEDDLTSKLERLAALNAAGALTDGEFSAAKAHVLMGC